MTTFPEKLSSLPSPCHHYFLKSAKVFGKDVVPVTQALAKQGLKKTYRDPEEPILEFPLTYVKRLSKLFPDLEIGISYHVVKEHEGGLALRELCLAFTTPSAFDFERDV